MIEPSRPIRILRVIARLNIGGPAIHVTLLADRFRPPDYETTLVAGRIGPGEGDMQYYAESLGVQPVIIPELGRALHPLRDLATLWKLYRLIRQVQPDVVHTHTSKAGFVGRVAAWLAGVPVIVHTFHGHAFHSYFGPLLTRLFILLERLTARMTDTIITLTEGLRRELVETYHIARGKQFIVLPLGLDLEGFTRTARGGGAFRAAWGLPPAAPLVGIVGRVVPIKNHRLFLEAAARVRAQLPAARFAVIGDGESRPEMEALAAALGLADAVTFTGWQRDLAAIYSDLDVLVVSSVNEGTPVSVIEALAAGCPVVATAVGGLPDLLEGGKLGRLTPPGDSDALAAAIVETLQAPPAGEAARQLMLNRYGINRLASDLDSLYRGLLARKRRAAR